MAAEKAIESDLVSVNGKLVKDTKFQIGRKDIVEVGGKQLKQKENIYLVLNKPADIICQKTNTGEKTIYDIISKIPELDEKSKRTLFSVGRLDKDTEGLLVVTNDGQMEKLLAKPENKIQKTYFVKSEKQISGTDMKKLEDGVNIFDDDLGKTFFVKAIKTKLISERQCEIIIDEGKKRQVRKMFDAIGNKVIFLKRVAIGNMVLQDIGFQDKQYKIFTLNELRKAVGVRKA